eukprot:364516-Chlamydomonas_euryale.AAC.6
MPHWTTPPKVTGRRHRRMGMCMGMGKCSGTGMGAGTAACADACAGAGAGIVTNLWGEHVRCAGHHMCIADDSCEEAMEERALALPTKKSRSAPPWSPLL